MRNKSKVAASRMTILEATRRSLEDVGHPMHSRDIADYIERKGWVKFRGKTPDKSIQGAVIKHIKASGPKAIVRRIGKRGAGSMYGIAIPRSSRLRRCLLDPME